MNCYPTNVIPWRWLVMLRKRLQTQLALPLLAHHYKDGCQANTERGEGIATLALFLSQQTTDRSLAQMLFMNHLRQFE
jgi:hypothetical protein